MQSWANVGEKCQNYRFFDISSHILYKRRGHLDKKCVNRKGLTF